MFESIQVAGVATILVLVAANSGCESSASGNNAGAPQNPSGTPVDMPSSPTQAGQVVVSEIMANPTALADSAGEWFELANSSQSDFNLRDCVISDASTSNFVVDSDLVIAAAAFLTFANSANPGFVPDFDYGNSGLSLNNSNEFLALTCNGVEIGRHDYATSSPGQAAALSSTGNAAWCDDAVNDYGSGDTGTPGTMNIGCR